MPEKNAGRRIRTFVGTKPLGFKQINPVRLDLFDLGLTRLTAPASPLAEMKKIVYKKVLFKIAEQLKRKNLFFLIFF